MMHVLSSEALWWALKKKQPIICGGHQKQLKAGHVAVFQNEKRQQWAGIFKREPTKNAGAT